MEGLETRSIMDHTNGMSSTMFKVVMCSCTLGWIPFVLSWKLWQVLRNRIRRTPRKAPPDAAEAEKGELRASGAVSASPKSSGSLQDDESVERRGRPLSQDHGKQVNTAGGRRAVRSALPVFPPILEQRPAPAMWKGKAPVRPLFRPEGSNGERGPRPRVMVLAE
ncbi:hypothetical protein NKR23_g8566 [Pleurostoma richardsiae]|uniref:Uncharacterized protein n=1 Tax=Pleurostoma richardsiae TaxID=41990 RepID=A0AA38VPG1_9PEZI|nr:hypothetical protein NKR23_g8566 [Pleurostoma richardsiae]